MNHFSSNGTRDNNGELEIISKYMLCPDTVSRKYKRMIYNEKASLKTGRNKKSGFFIQQSRHQPSGKNVYFQNQSAEYFGPNVSENPLNWFNLKEKHFCKLSL